MIRKTLGGVIVAVGMIVLSGWGLPASAGTADTIRFKMVVTNPSDTDPRTVPVRTYLPRGIKPDDVVEKNNFSVEYDFDKSQYFAYQEIKLEPNQSVTLEVGVRDIWVIPDAELEPLKEHTKELTEALKTTEYADQAKALEDSVAERVNKIRSAQGQTDIPVDQRIAGYEASAALLKEVRRDIGAVEDIAMEAGRFSGGKLGRLMGESSLSAAGPQDPSRLGTLKFRVEIRNPSDQPRTIPFKYYLPSEVRPEHIVNAGGLKAGYDFQLGQEYLAQEALALGPSEKKVFEIEVRDLWVIPETRLQAARSRTKQIEAQLAQTDYKSAAGALADRITSNLDNILGVQNNKELSVESHIGGYRQNLDRFQEVQKDIARLEKFLVQAGGSLSSLEEKPSKNNGKGYRTSGPLVQGSKGLEIIGRSMFRGRAPDMATTWKIILTIIAFLGLLSFLFFILWWTQVKSKIGKGYSDVQSDDSKPKTDDL
eukprot:Pompholyxophrys_punicea_v1_NODE_64_length_3937_cov_2.858836.p1 type:complete len:482 gc:universal NODE_64_length_3937_cov_2.858836:2762-1317(-)